MDKLRSYFIWGAATLAVVIVVAIIVKAMSVPSVPLNLDTVKIGADEWTKGSRDAEVTIVEYGDFECPGCARYESVVKAITDEFGNKILYVYRHFPLRDIHTNAMTAVRASEAAGKQNKFWEMHDKLYDKQDEWAGKFNSRDFFTRYASELGLDAAKFKTDLDSSETKAIAEGSYRSAMKLKIPGTPTFFLNGTQIKTPVNFDSFKKLIEDELAK